MKTYRGVRYKGDFIVSVFKRGRAHRLPLRLDLENHSPTGFAWGYGGSGPAQLALALLADVLHDDRRAVRLHQPFKRAIIAGLDIDGNWELNEALIWKTVSELEEAEGKCDDS